MKARKVRMYCGIQCNTMCVSFGRKHYHLGKCYMLAHMGKNMGWRFWSFLKFFLCSATFKLISLDGMYNQEDSNTLKNTSLGYYMQKLQEFEAAYIGLKPTPIGLRAPYASTRLFVRSYEGMWSLQDSIMGWAQHCTLSRFLYNLQWSIECYPGGCTPLSSRTPRARQKNPFFLSCITKRDKNLINFFHE